MNDQHIIFSWKKTTWWKIVLFFVLDTDFEPGGDLPGVNQVLLGVQIKMMRVDDTSMSGKYKISSNKNKKKRCLWFVEVSVSINILFPFAKKKYLKAFLPLVSLYYFSFEKKIKNGPSRSFWGAFLVYFFSFPSFVSVVVLCLLSHLDSHSHV